MKKQPTTAPPPDGLREWALGSYAQRQRLIAAGQPDPGDETASAEQVARFYLERDAPPPSPPIDRTAVEAHRQRKALVERLYMERRSIVEAEAIADLVEDEGLDLAEAIRRYDAGEGEHDDNMC